MRTDWSYVEKPCSQNPYEGELLAAEDVVYREMRTRLDAILKEQQLILTDLMKPAAALKIGELVPIDALLSGTYTKLKSYIDDQVPEMTRKLKGKPQYPYTFSRGQDFPVVIEE